MSVKIYETALIGTTTVVASISGRSGTNTETLTGTIQDNGDAKFKF